MRTIARSREPSPERARYTYQNPDLIDPELKCPICFEPLLDPVVMGCCKNTLCRQCFFVDSKECYLCRQDPTPLQDPPRLVHSMLSRIMVKCSSCLLVMPRDEFRAHLHNVCPIDCPNGCPITQTRSSLSNHDQFCLAKVIPCLANDVGCPFKGTRETMDTHIQNCFFVPQRLLLLKISQLEEQQQIQQLAIEQLQRASRKYRMIWKTQPNTSRVHFILRGYHFRVQFQRKGEKFGVYLHVIPGKKDADLPWPVQSTFSVQVLNQLRDADHQRVFSFQTGQHPLNFSRPVGNDLGRGWSGVIENVPALKPEFCVDQMVVLLLKLKLTSHLI